ncbi:MULTISPECIES: helix-turn-helix domain-containing protein [unclassified Arthrobacter]|jgi:DNA-binding transcriptional ArsR family regulator|uniref:helix-turn-helix domain-containing protein n=1 Tax=unclassified Arthrobacter TaxID=235627 RepID=UPI00254D9EC4|nr:MULTISPECIES: helix-turn-helix domain-containing protein [unclassified Arthrobacter]
MPRYVRPKAPASLEAAIDAFGGNHAKVAVLGFLTEKGPATAAEVADGTGLGRPTVKAHLYQLADAGVVVADPARVLPVEDRTGRRVKYSVVTDELRRHYEALGRSFGLVD